MKFDREMLRLYAVTDRSWIGRQSLCEQIEDALKGGVTIIQLREKNLEKSAFIEEAIAVRQICRRYNVPLIINDSVEVALASGADGVHVGIEDVPVKEIRRQVPKDFIIGATAKTVMQAVAAEESGADYLGIGAVFPSPTKKTAIRITKDDFIKIKSSVSLPAVAIGGINYSNIDELACCGADGFAVVSAIFAAQNVQEAAEKLRKKIDAII